MRLSAAGGAVLACLTVSAASFGSTALQPKVSAIVRDQKPEPKVYDVTLRDLNDRIIDKGQPLSLREVLPGDVQVQVPWHDEITIAAGRSRLTIEPSSSVALESSANATAVMVDTGKADVDDPLDFYDVKSHNVVVAHHSTIFSVEANASKVVVSTKEGSVEATLAGSSSTGSTEAIGVQTSAEVASAYAKRVDSISSSGRRSSISYSISGATSADVSLAEDKSLAAAGNVDAMYSLGSRYYLGIGAKRDYAEALHWLQAAAQTSATARNELGYMYERGDGVPQDVSAASHWFQLAADQRNADAENNLGVLYLDRSYTDSEATVCNDDGAAFSLFQRAAEQQNADAESNIGYMYQYGLCRSQNYSLAFAYFRRSANAGSPKGEANLGVLYANGKGVQRNDRAALHEFELSAAQGDAFGESGLGWMYDPLRNSIGIPPNQATADHYYQLSTRQVPNTIFYEPGTAPQGLEIVKRIAVGRSPVWAAITPDGREVYVANSDGNSVSVISTADLALAPREIRLPGEHPHPGAVVVSHDGRKVYVSHNDGGGISVIDVATKRMESIPGPDSPTEVEHVRNMAITPDDRRLFLATEFQGLQVVDLAARSVERISNIVCPEALDVTPDGRRLYVNYQCFGPGGRPGHDAVGVFRLDPNLPCTAQDTRGCVLDKTIQGFPNVGGKIALSPDGSQLWLNGIDACNQPAYDHDGCAMVPGDIINVIDTSTNSLFKSLVFPPQGTEAISFVPGGSLVVVGGGGPLKVIDWHSLRFLQPLPITSAGVAAFSRDGTLIFVPVHDESVVDVIRVI